MDFTVSGRMPARARMHVEPVEREDEEGNPMLAAYDITLTDERGQEWQPAHGQPATVTITDPSFGDGKKLDIFHETDDGREYVASVVSVNNTVTFPAKHFSVFVIATQNGINRMVVSFVTTVYDSNSTPPGAILLDTTSRLVKCRDTVDNGYFMPRLVYPPRIEYIPEGAHFFGWSQKPFGEYTVNPEDRMTINVVREMVYDRLKNGGEIEEDCKDTMFFSVVLLRDHDVYYRSLKNPKVIIGVDPVLFLLNDPVEQQYVINGEYVPNDESANFQGWLLVDSLDNVTSPHDPDQIFADGDTITLKGDITLLEELAYGYWLVFNENKQGATYTAPKFLKTDEIQGIPGDPLENARPENPECYGFDFGGWCTDSTLTQPFQFDGYLHKDTTIYAKWNDKDSAFYTIVVWQQQLDDPDKYDFAGSYVGQGRVGDSIIANLHDIEVGTLNDLRYVTLFPNTDNPIKLGGIKSVKINTVSDPFTGFTLSTTKPLQDTVVTTTGQSVINVYFDRMTYTVRFYVAETDNDDEHIALGINIKGATLGKSKNPEDFLGKWNESPVSLSRITKIRDVTPTEYEMKDSKRYYYFTLTGRYGADIDTLWPKYEDIDSTHFNASGGYRFVSWILMDGAKSFSPGTSQAQDGSGNGGNTVKGNVSILDEHILGRLDLSNGNLLTARYGNKSYNWNYYIHLEGIDGSYDPAADTIYARSGGNNQREKAPSFDGFEDDVNRYEQIPSPSEITAHSVWNTNAPPYEAHFYYNRKSYTIIFSDGVYLDSKNNQLKNKGNGSPFDFFYNIQYGSDISDTVRHFRPSPSQTEPGFVFDGWFMDAGCKQPFDYNNATMPKSNLVLYAQWRQVAYRVFLHPQAGSGAQRDGSLEWGEENASMCFNVAYGGKVSERIGQRDLYEFGGWYLEPSCKTPFAPKKTELIGQDFLKPYIKKGVATDSMDKWGDLHVPYGYSAPYNKDTLVVIDGVSIGQDRFWITQRLDLYARWRHKLDGAEGISVEYVCKGCDSTSMPKPDSNFYLDKSKMVASQAPVPAKNNTRKIFSYWVLQSYTSGKFVDSVDETGHLVYVYPGGPFTLHLPYARRKVDSNSVSYTYRLRAELDEFEDNHTFIVWYQNWFNPADPERDTIRYDIRDTLTINMTVPIPYPDEIGDRPGYIYKGWHKQSYSPEESGEETTHPPLVLGDTASVNFLWFKPDEGERGQYYSDSSFAPEYRAYGVGADEKTPYDYFYAAWEPIKYTVRFNRNNERAGGTMDTIQNFKYDERKWLTKNGFISHCQRFLGWARTPDGPVVLYDEQDTMNLTLVDGDTIDLYAQWDNEDPSLVVTPTNATCLTLGEFEIDLQGISMPNYTYRAISLDTAVTPHVARDTVWHIVSTDTLIFSFDSIYPGKYRVEAVTASGCMRDDTVMIALDPWQIPIDTLSDNVCNGSPFIIKISSNDSVRYLWDAPEIVRTNLEMPLTVSPSEANDTLPVDYITCTITGSAESIKYTIYPILGYCTYGSVKKDLDLAVTTYPPITLSLTDPDTLCAGQTQELTAITDTFFYNKTNPYTLNWVFQGDTISDTIADHRGSVTRSFQVPDICRGDYSVEVFYADLTECRVNALKTIKVRIKDWQLPSQKDSVISCVADAVRPDEITPSVMPEVRDGCDSILTPTFYNMVKNPSDLHCYGTVTYEYMYKDCEGKEKFWDFVYHVQKDPPSVQIDSVPPPVPDGRCWYGIPKVKYSVSDCDTSSIRVVQSPPVGASFPQRDTSYVVKITLTAVGHCHDTTEVDTNVTIPAHPTVTAHVADREFCVGDTTRVWAVENSVNGAPNLVWSAIGEDGEEDGVFVYPTAASSDTLFTAMDPVVYTLTVKFEENGCVAADTTHVTVNPVAILDPIYNRNQTVCLGSPITTIYVDHPFSDIQVFGDFPDGVYFDSEGSRITGTPLARGVYKIYLRAYTESGCGEKWDTVLITVLENSTETVDILGNPVICEGRTDTLYVVVPGAIAYRWSWSGAQYWYAASDSSSQIIDKPGDYTVDVTTVGGCVSHGEITVKAEHLPSVTINGLDDPICPSVNEIRLTATISSQDDAEYTYHWTIASNEATIVPPDASDPLAKMMHDDTVCNAIYPVTLLLTDNAGCKVTVKDTIVMQDNTPPRFTLTRDWVDAESLGECQFQVPVLDTLIVDREDECGGDVITENAWWGAADGWVISTTDSVTIFVEDGCRNRDSVKVEVRVPYTGVNVVERDSIVLNSFVWKDHKTYTESQSFIEGTSSVEGVCTTSRINFIVLQSDDVSDTICKGDSTELVANVRLSPFKVRPAVGDVLCLKPAAGGYDTLVLRPDTFLARANGESLEPIGVVFYVDPKDNRFTKSLALVDANSGNTCIWANNTNVGDLNDEHDGFPLNAAYDTSGLVNTRNIISTAGTTYIANAAECCYYYNPLATTTLSNQQPLGWYLPSAGELCLYYAQRIPVNQTLHKLDSASFNAVIPFATYNRSNDATSEGTKGYWSSTDYSSSNANYVDQRGRIQNASKTSTSKNVRAVFSYHSAGEYDAAPYNIGEVITFKDNSQGVICYVDPENPYKGWVAALKDVNNPNNSKDLGLIRMSYGPDDYGIDRISLDWEWKDNTEDGNLYARYNLTSWAYPASGRENTMKLYVATSTVTNTMQQYNYSVSNGWYIPDMLQLRLWYALFPIIKLTTGVDLPNTSWTETNPNRCLYWSSTGTKENDFGCLYFQDGDIRSRSAKKLKTGGVTYEYRSYHLRPVRDFDFTPDLLVYWDSMAAEPLEDTTDRMTVSPLADTTYYATVEYTYYEGTFRTLTTKLPGHVKVWPKPEITVEEGQSRNYCQNEPAAALGITAMTEGPEPVSYSWMVISVTDLTDTAKDIGSEATYTPSTSAAGDSIYAVIVSNGCGSDTAVVARISVFAVPTYTVSNQSANYCKDADATPLKVTITGDGTYTVTWKDDAGDTLRSETAGAGDFTYTPSTSTVGETIYSVSVSNGNGTCDTEAVVGTVTVSGADVPVIQIASQNNPDGACVSSVTAPTFTVIDPYNSAAEAVVSTDGPTTADNCHYTQTWRANYSGGCANAEQVFVIYTWTHATTPTITTELALEDDLGCAELIAPEVSDFTVVDGCASNTQVTLDDGVETTDGCTHTKVWTASYAGSCNKSALPVTITRTWTVGETPTISTELALEDDLGCELPTAPVVSDFTVVDVCNESPQVTLDDGVETTEGCTHTKVWTASYTGTCNSATPVTVTRTWRVREIQSVTINGLDNPICPSEHTIPLTATVSPQGATGYTYLWTTTSSEVTIDPSNAPNPTATVTHSSTICNATYPVTLVVTDHCGCQVTARDTIVMQDNTPPTFTLKSTSVDAEDIGGCQFRVPALDTLIVNPSDVCSGTVTIKRSWWGEVNNWIISSTDSVTIFVEDGCHNRDSVKVEVQVPYTDVDVVERDTIVFNSFVWIDGKTYTKSQSFIEGTSYVGGKCTSSRINFIVLQADEVSDTICEGESTELVANVHLSPVEVRPAVGDVLCLKPATGSGYDTLVLRPDTFLARHYAGESLQPIGVVFFVDPNDEWHGRALALVDAHNDSCRWSVSNDDVVNDGTTTDTVYIMQALLDLDGLTKTEKMLLHGANNAKAPAAYYCYYYDPLTGTTDPDLQPRGWYLPSAGEMCICYAQRLTINNSLRKLRSIYPANQVDDHVAVPFDKNKNDTGYWVSTRCSKQYAYHLNQKGQLKGHFKNGSPTIDKNGKVYPLVKKRVRAVCRY